MNFFEFLQKFPTENAVIEHFTKTRYRLQKPTCPFCQTSKRVVTEKHRLRYFHCNACNSSFSVFKDTIFQKSTTDLRKWMYAIHLFLNGKKGISGYQLQREIGVPYKTCWRMLKQIRIAMGNVENPAFINTILEIDETYIGGKPRKANNHKNQPKTLKRGRGTNKTPVIGIIDRNSKYAYAKVALPNKAGKKLSGNQLLNVLEQVAVGPNTIMTDEFKPYGILATTEHRHFRIDHSQMFASGDKHTNNIENFWSTMKRGIVGIYHHVSDKHLQNYINEFCFRYNNRANAEAFDSLLTQCVVL